ncbi:MAG: RagB/SusD family nutrient uptake outer membrane protein [Bacteroidetes bacterium HGW-Bacteroidetes-3]|nr:MAG: RagB/SusD family nutrient uptake outer membrane protein [Bacteroidetes bacterium HGW-Bacteroidetes-3]
MKNISKIIGFVILLSAFAGCEKQIDFDPHDEYQVTELDFLKTASDYQTMAVSAYSPLQWMNQLVVVGDIATDNAVAGGENASDVVNLQQIDDYTTTTNNGHLEELWKVAYEGVNRVNYLTSHKDKNLAGEAIEFNGKEALYGELYFLRAYYYFNLTRMFGDVVLFTDRKLAIADFGSLQRSPKADVYAQIEADLKAAIAVLPPTNPEAGRITRYAAQALLGKVLLYQDKLPEAATMLENVVNGPFSLVTDFDSIFLKEGENGPEAVFEIQYSNGFPYWNWGGATRGQGNYAAQQCGVRGLSGTADMPYASGWSTNLPTQELAAAYEAGDQRKDATVFDVEQYKIDNPALSVKFDVAPYKNTGLYNKKYLPRKGQTSGQPELNYENNQRIIRYSDVLLMAAEANVATNPAKAQAYLDRVRDRAFGDAAHRVTATKQAIWNERRLELAMEGDRLFDLIRTGQAASKISGFVVGKNEVFPIPQREIDISRLTQNPNW